MCPGVYFITNLSKLKVNFQVFEFFEGEDRWFSFRGSACGFRIEDDRSKTEFRDPGAGSDQDDFGLRI